MRMSRNERKSGAKKVAATKVKPQRNVDFVDLIYFDFGGTNEKSFDLFFLPFLLPL